MRLSMPLAEGRSDRARGTLRARTFVKVRRGQRPHEVGLGEHLMLVILGVMRVLLLVAVVVSLLAGASAAGAAVTPLTLGKGDLPGVAVDVSGNAYVAWRGASAQNVRPLMFCRVAKGASTCAARAISVPGTSQSQPFVFVVGTRVLVLESRNSSDVFLLASTDGGATFGPARNLGQLGLLLDAVAGPGDTISLVATYAANLRFVNVAVDGTGPAPPFATLSPSGTSFDFAAVDLVGSTPFVLLYDGNGNALWRRWAGSGDLNDAASWTAPSTRGYLGEEPGLAGGPLGLFASGRLGPTSTRPVVRRFVGSGFTAPTVIEPTSANPSIAQDAGKRLHAVYGGFDLEHAVSDNGTTWRVETLVRGASAVRPRLAATADHSGVVVYSSSGDVRLARLGRAATVTGTSKTIKVAGGSVTLRGPRNCVPPHESFIARLTYKRRGRLQRVSRVDFLIDGRRQRVDRTFPFRQSLLQFNVPAGTAHSLKARATIRLRGGKSVRRTIGVHFAYCAATAPSSSSSAAGSPRPR